MPVPTIGYAQDPDPVRHAMFEGKVLSVCERVMTTLTKDDWPGMGGGSLCEECCHRLGPDPTPREPEHRRPA